MSFCALSCNLQREISYSKQDNYMFFHNASFHCQLLEVSLITSSLHKKKKKLRFLFLAVALLNLDLK